MLHVQFSVVTPPLHNYHHSFRVHLSLLHILISALCSQIGIVTVTNGKVLMSSKIPIFPPELATSLLKLITTNAMYTFQYGVSALLAMQVLFSV
jgi:hypothetical protein